MSSEEQIDKENEEWMYSEDEEDDDEEMKLSDEDLNIAYRNKILEVLSEGEPYGEEELWQKVGGYVSMGRFKEQMGILLDKTMVRTKNISQEDDCDGQTGYIDLTIYWTSYYHETINKKREAKEMARPYLEGAAKYLKDMVESMERALNE